MTRRIFMQKGVLGGSHLGVVFNRKPKNKYAKIYFGPKLPLNRFLGVFNAFKYIEITQGNIYAKGQLQRMDPDSSF